MITEWLAAILARDLRAMAREVRAYPDDASVWQTLPGVTNSGGTLALHAEGNIRHFIGSVLGGTGYVRDRDAEFSRRGVPREELASGLEAAATEVAQVLPGVPAARLNEPWPAPVGGVHVTTGDFLTHLAAHLGYHLGQADYHRRIVTGSSQTVGTQAMPELATARKA